MTPALVTSTRLLAPFAAAGPQFPSASADPLAAAAPQAGRS
jgi:hypothetical protein